jgi:hypothetical protein
MREYLRLTHFWATVLLSTERKLYSSVRFSFINPDTNFMYSPLAVFVQLRRYINIHTSTSSYFLITQHYMFRSNWPSSGVQHVGLKEPAALLSRWSIFQFDVK